MKNFFIATVFFMTIIQNLYSQNINLIKQGAVNYIRGNCKAPSTFILTDKLGNKITVNSLKYKIIKEHVRYDSIISRKGTSVDSIIICKHKKGIDPFHYRAYENINVGIRLYSSLEDIIAEKEKTTREATSTLFFDEIEKEKSFDIMVDSLTFFGNNDYPLIDTLIYRSHKKPLEITYQKHNYNATYTFSFYYEAQNPMGGLVQNFAVVHYDTKLKVYYEGELRYSTSIVGTKFKPISQKPKKIIYIFH